MVGNFIYLNEKLLTQSLNRVLTKLFLNMPEYWIHLNTHYFIDLSANF